MVSNNTKVSGVVGTVSKQAGAVVGTSVAISRKISGAGVKGVTAAKDLLVRPLKKFTPTPSQAPESDVTNETTVQKDSTKALITALESDLSNARQELKKAQNNAEKTQSQLESLEAEKDSLASDLEKTRSEVQEAASREGAVKEKLTALESELATVMNELGKKQSKAETKPVSSKGGKQNAVTVSTKKQVKPPVKATTGIDERAKAKAGEKLSKRPVSRFTKSVPPGVTLKEVQAAVFTRATDSVILTRALSDIASGNAVVRADAIKTLVCVRHELAIKALAAQLAFDKSAHVRQECVKTLAKLGMEEGIEPVKRALADEVAPVRLTAVWALYRLAGPKSATALVSSLSDNDDEVRRRAAACIGWLGREELAVKLVPLLSDSNVSVRLAAVEAMGNLGSREVVSDLIEQLNDPDNSVKRSVLKVIETITDKKMSRTFPRDKQAYQHLIERWRQWWTEQLQLQA